MKSVVSCLMLLFSSTMALAQGVSPYQVFPLYAENKSSLPAPSWLYHAYFLNVSVGLLYECSASFNQSQTVGNPITINCNRERPPLPGTPQGGTTAVGLQPSAPGTPWPLPPLPAFWEASQESVQTSVSLVFCIRRNDPSNSGTWACNEQLMEFVTRK
jgi:hypothetical protein